MCQAALLPLLCGYYKVVLFQWRSRWTASKSGVPTPPSTSNAIFGLSQIPAENVYGSLLFKILAASRHNSYYLLNENQAVVNAPLLWQSGALGNEGHTHSLFSELEGSIPLSPSLNTHEATGMRSSFLARDSLNISFLLKRDSFALLPQT